MQHTPLVEHTRGGTRENLHYGAIAVCDAAGRAVAQAGNPHTVVFTRSTLKPFQALPLLEAGGAARFGLDAPQLALLCASHNGEPEHVAQVQRLLDASHSAESQLACGCHEPYYVELGVGPAPQQVDQRHHNCSGKHAGFLAHCVQQGWPRDGYLEAGHPLQQAVRAQVARLAGTPPEALPSGTDGCSAPNYALPLARLATAFARLARGADDAEHGGSFGPLADAMAAHPSLGSGTGRNDAAFLRAGAGDWVSKVGADGVQCIGSRSRAMALAIKVSDGNKPALHAATVEALEQLGWLDGAQRAALAPWRAPDILSVRGAVVGARRPVFQLAFS